MTSTEIAVRDAGTVAVSERDVVDGWITVAADVSKLADYIAETDFVPRALRNKPAAVAACILTGRELGIGPMASLKSIHMVQGVPSLSAEYKRARAMAAGHEIAVDETNATRCIVRGRRAGSDRWVTVQWNLDMARRAKIASKDVWQQYPQRMLQARATSELCDLLFPDATLGLETTEVLEDGGALAIAEGVVIESAETPAIEPPKPAPRTAQRRKAPANASPAQPVTPPAPASPVPQGAGEALPPLPGEEEEESSGAAVAAAVPDDTDAPGSEKHRKLVGIVRAHFKRLGYNDDRREERLEAAAVLAAVSGITTLNDLTPEELSPLADTMARCRNSDALMALIVAADKAAHDGE